MQRQAIWDYLSRRPDLPTYVGGWMASLAWLSVVGATVGDGPFNLVIDTDTTVGFVLSFWLRGYVGTPQWTIIRGSLLAPSVILRLAFMLLCVLPGLRGKAPFSSLVPDIAFGTDDWLIGTGFMWAMALYSFGLVSDGLVAFGSVMGLAMMGLMASVNVNPEVGVAFMIFLLGNILLLGNLTLSQHASWRRRGDRKLLVRWLVDQLIVAALTVAATSTAAIVLAFVLQRISPPGLVPVVKLPAAIMKGGSFTTGYASFSDQMQIGVGTNAEAESPVVFEATAAEPLLWRRLVYDSFTGRVWRYHTATTRPVGFLNDAAGTDVDDNLAWASTLKAGRPVTATVTYRMNTSLSAPPRLVHVTKVAGDQELAQLRVDSYGNVSASIEPGTTLSLRSVTPSPTPDQLAAAPRVDPVDWREYLKVPTPTRPSIAAASRTIVARTGDNPYAIAQGIQDWLETEFIYDLTYQAPQHTNAVEHYLEHKHGACDMIATAMALLARHNEIPARVAVGFGPGVATGRDLWTIRMRDAHAWAELYFPGYGWIAFNPAVPAPAVDPQAEALAFEIVGLRVTPRSLARLAVGLMVAWLALYALRHWWRRRRQAWRPLATDSARSLTGLLARLRGLFHREPNPVGAANLVLSAYHDALRLLARNGCRRDGRRRPGPTPPAAAAVCRGAVAARLGSLDPQLRRHTLPRAAGRACGLGPGWAGGGGDPTGATAQPPRPRASRPAAG